MGTRLEHIVNPLADCKKSSIVAGSVANDREIRRKRLTGKMSGVEKLQDTMNRTMEKGDVEAIKNTMLIHEDVFKHQVTELHRLYCVQKKLTVEFRANSSSGNTRKSIGIELERPGEEDLSTGKSAINEDRADQRSGHDRENKNTMKTHNIDDEDFEVGLTLSIGGNPREKRSKSPSFLKHRSILKGISFSSSFKFEREKDSNGRTTPGSSSSATCDPDAKGSLALPKFKALG